MTKESQRIKMKKQKEHEAQLHGDDMNEEGAKRASNHGRDAAEARAHQLYVEYLQNAGLAQGRRHVEVLLMLPLSFLRIYEQLFQMAFNEATIGMVGTNTGKANESKAEVGVRSNPKAYADRNMGTGGLKGKQGKSMVDRRGGGEVRVGTGGGGKRYKANWVIGNERAFDVKKIMDKRLERLGVEMLEELRMGNEGGGRDEGAENVRIGATRKCAGKCGRYLREGWLYCPYDGTRN